MIRIPHQSKENVRNFSKIVLIYTFTSSNQLSNNKNALYLNDIWDEIR